MQLPVFGLDIFPVTENYGTSKSLQQSMSLKVVVALFADLTEDEL